MVDSITDEDISRVEGYVPEDLSSEGDIEDHIKSRFSNFPDAAVEKFADQIAEDRTEEGRAARSVINDKTEFSGRGATGTRTKMVKDSEGHYFGSKDNVKTWTDQHGNLMGHNTNTGKRKKIADSSEVQN